MDLLPTEEQQQIVDTARQFLEREFPLASALQLEPDEQRLRREDLVRVAELGWIGIGLEAQYGGVGFGLSEEMLLFIELGRSLMPPSLLGAVLGARLAAHGGAEQSLGGILDGRCKVTVAVQRPGAACAIGQQVQGEFLAYEIQDADYLLIADTGGAALLQPGELVTQSTPVAIDPTLSLSVLRADDVRAAAYVGSEQVDLYYRGALLCAALLCGIAEATLDRSVAYAREREQYGKPIGSFQAIKHYCAEMAIRCESLRAILHHASITLSAGGDSGRFDVHTAKALAVEIAQHNANTAVQIHGGMGYTEEMDIHLFVKRAQLLATLFGGERQHLRQLLALSQPV